MRVGLALGLTILCAILPAARAQNAAFTYQGRVTDNGTNFTGIGLFKFAVVTSVNSSSTATATANLTGQFLTSVSLNAAGNGYVSAPTVTISGGGGAGAAAHANISAGAVTAIIVDNAGSNYTSLPTVTVAPPPPNISYTSYWSNDGLSWNGSEPLAAVGVPVSNGLFTVVLGDTNQPNMIEPVSPGMFSQPNLQLRIWFDDGINGSAALSPLQNLTTTPYAAHAVLADFLINGPSIQTNSDGAPNVIAGASLNYVSNGVEGATISGGGAINYLGGGSSFSNSVTGNYGTVGGGLWDVAGQFATASGGIENSANGEYSTVAGGEGNVANAQSSTVGGGGGNHAWGDNSTVAGGSGNYAGGADATIAGGYYNNAGTFDATIAGGNYNTASGTNSSVGGGAYNQATNLNATVCGGTNNLAGATYASVAGGWNNSATGNSSFVGAGIGNTASGNSSVVAGGSANKATNLYATVSGGNANLASGQFATVGGGIHNQATNLATIGGGTNNLAISQSSTVGGGINNSATGNASTIPGGDGNSATGDHSTAIGWGANSTTQGAIAIGTFLSASGSNSIALGNNTSASGYASTAMGQSTVASGQYSFAAGYYAQATNSGAFVWADNSTATPITSTNSNSVTMRSVGGYRLFSGSSSGVFLAPTATSWATISDKNAKKNFAPVDGEAILDKLAAIPVEQWNYKWESDGVTPNIGPMAQDFKAAFYPGRDDKSITTLEFDGVELAAIQGLNQKLGEKDAEIQTLKEKIDSLEKRLDEMQKAR